MDVDAAPTGSDVLGEIAALASTDDISVTLTLSGDLEFDGNLSDSAFVQGAANTQCALQISAGGANGGTSVTFESDSSFDGGTCTAGNLEFTIPITANGAGNITSLVELSATGTDLGGDSYDADGTGSAGDLVEADSGYTIGFGTAGTTTVDLDADYEQFNTLDASATVGSVSFEAEAVSFAASGTTGFDPASITAADQIDGVTVTFTAPAPAGLASITFNGDTVAINQTTGTAEFDFTTGDLGALTDGENVVLTAATGDDAAAIGNQQLSVAFSVDVDAAADLTVADDSGNMDELVREGSNSTTFEWVGDSAASTGNVFRLVGFGDTLPTIRVTLTNSLNDVDGEYVVTPANALANGELIMTATDIQNAVGSAFGRADVAFSVEAGGVVIRRFMVTNGVIGDMGDDNG